MKQDEMKIDFETLHIRYYYNEEYKVMSDEAREYARKHYFNVVKIIEVDLKAIK
jgi:hypothetical protein